MIAVFTKCKKAPTINPILLLSSLVPEQKDFLDRIGNKFIISPNLDIFGEPDDQIVARHMTNLKNYIAGIPNLYTADTFKKVCSELQERERQQMRGNQTKPYQRNDGCNMINFNFVKTNVFNLSEEESCFAADSKVTLQNGKITKVSELIIGDQVCCGFENGKQVFSEVVLFIHADHNKTTEFQLINFIKQDGSQGDIIILIYPIVLFFL
jgi:hypothetical protein